MSDKQKERKNRLFIDACSEIDRAGCRLLPLDYVELHRLAQRVVAPEFSGVSLFMVKPVIVGRCVLQVPTIGAMLWWDQCGQAWYGSDETMGAIAFAYLCANGRDAEAISRMYVRADADAALLKFRVALGTTATTHELSAGIDRLDANMAEAFGDGENKDADSSPRWYGDIVARLCAAYQHLDPKSAAFNLSVDECAALLRVAPSPMGVARPDNDADFSAFAEFKAYVRKLKEERKCLASE